ncbi:serine hydrolase domain-containing protein [Ferruginibacter yonginensis]|uniref:Serine hydrolase domain-containing protein n=1 Tax=Ferruginibacter yonginensis TaxID=1310416 RepID=A0ABV8QU01_9BACT
MKKLLLAFLGMVLLWGCKKSNDTATSTTPPQNPTPAEPYYYPPLTGDVWETKTSASIGWDDALLNQALDYAGTKNSYGIVILHHGKIVKERYWNNWTMNTPYFIASAGKSVAAFIAGIAQQEGTININNKVSQYLGTGWTSLPLAKENLITVKNQLTMTTGLDDGVPDQDCTTPSCLIYKADAGTRWAYHNAPYHLLQNVIANASGQTFQQYSKAKLFTKIGMNNAFWFNYVMYCTTREASRFGSLILTKGKWNGTALLNDDAYFNSMVNTSQPYNLSYGYLWWLNGKASSMVPGSQFVFQTSLTPSAPTDMIMALGKDDKKIYVVPSLDVVVVRLGDSAGTTTLGPSSFDNEFWTRLKPAMRF